MDWEPADGGFWFWWLLLLLVGCAASVATTLLCLLRRPTPPSRPLPSPPPPILDVEATSGTYLPPLPLLDPAALSSVSFVSPSGLPSPASLLPLAALSSDEASDDSTTWTRRRPEAVAAARAQRRAAREAAGAAAARAETEAVRSELASALARETVLRMRLKASLDEVDALDVALHDARMEGGGRGGSGGGKSGEEEAWEEKVRVLEEELEGERDEREEAEARVGVLEGRNSELERRLGELQAEAEDARKEASTLTSQLSYEAGEEAELKAEISRLRGALAHKDSQLEAASKEVDQRVSEIRYELERSRGKCAGLQARLDELELVRAHNESQRGGASSPSSLGNQIHGSASLPGLASGGAGNELDGLGSHPSLAELGGRSRPVAALAVSDSAEPLASDTVIAYTEAMAEKERAERKRLVAAREKERLRRLKPEIGLVCDRSLVVAKVAPGKTAFDAGLRVKDRVLKVAGTPVATLQDFARVISQVQVGDVIDVEISRSHDPDAPDEIPATSSGPEGLSSSFITIPLLIGGVGVEMEELHELLELIAAVRQP